MTSCKNYACKYNKKGSGCSLFTGSAWLQCHQAKKAESTHKRRVAK